MKLNLIFLFIFCCYLKSSICGSESNPPNWSNSVFVLDPSTPSSTQQIVDQIFAENGGHEPAFHGQFSSSRYALLFKPGTHNVKVNVGYYTSVIGLGKKPSDTNIQTIQCENGDFDYTGGALANFWRSVENVETGPMLWAVSQASPVRNVIVNGDLKLSEYNSGCCEGYSSGGFMANSQISGSTVSGSQQQWFTRNTNLGNGWNGGVWNMVFVGNSGSSPQSHCSNVGGMPYTSITQTPVIAEKPYISIDSSGNYYLQVPPLEYNKVGPTTNQDLNQQIPFSDVYVATPTDDVALINSKLASGLHLILTPGIYNLNQPIQVTQPNTVVLGIGFPTLIASSGAPAINVANVGGVRIGGILLEAGKQVVDNPTLLTWGDKTNIDGDPTNPSFMYDLFARVGGTNDPSVYQVQADVMVQINSGNVIIDNAWLWRADHDIIGQVINSHNPCSHGLEVNGNNVTTYGLAVEHTLQDLVIWNGEKGNVYFYQSELPYDVTQDNFGTPGYVSYRVSSQIQNHNAWGVGVYCYFAYNDVTVNNAIETGTSPNIVFVNSFTRFLNGYGSIQHIIDGKGDAVSSSNPLAYVCSN